MNELQRIIQCCARLRGRGEMAALATVVAVEGSTYRRPGARMLVSADGEAEGAISGGCLERDVFRQAARVLHGGQPVVAVYDSTGEDVDEGYSLGCNGVVVVLVEPLAPDGPAAALDFIADCMRRRRKGVVATVFAVHGAVRTRIGARLTLADDGATSATGIDDDSTRDRLFAEASKALRTGRSSRTRICTPSGEFEAFVEFIAPPLALTIFGAGPDAVPLAHFAQALGWHVRVVSRNAGHGIHARFASADRVLVAEADSALDGLSDEEGAIAAVMTHNYFEDLRVLRALVPRRLRYVALLGPKRRTARLLAALEEEGLMSRGEAAPWLHGPAGLDIGADTPEEIALAIVAEIRAVVAGRKGAFARERRGPMHPRSEARETALALGVPRSEVVCGVGAD
ncbi:XdhC family protein [Aromatoleum toluclasticum]|uniref:XdhC family protein n=1 Tax=Aromatoleum toluclasticum TaxID=92003 RepID=UPI001D197F9B|nr:XdhC/CoxI family protein [Aromatoleum toluclasticum]MCC4117536.1 XdhC family protein [Aromatoleum toluclasticum]